MKMKQASLSNLPLEITHLVLDNLADGSDEAKQGLKSLTMLDRKLASICSPRLWRDLYLRANNTKFPIDQVLSKYGQSVQTITLDFSQRLPPYNPLIRKKRRYNSKQKRRIRKAIATAPLPVDTDCFVRALRHCTHVHSLEVVRTCPQYPYGLLKCDQTNVSASSFLVSVSPQLTSLRHLKVQCSSLPVIAVIELLKNAPLLESFAYNISDFTKYSLDPIECLGKALAQLQHLTLLRLRVPMIHGAWCEYEWPGTVTQLYLQGRIHLNQDQCRKLVQQIAPNLKTFHHQFLLTNDPHHSLDPEIGYNLPMLTKLTIVPVSAHNNRSRWFTNCKKLKYLKYHDLCEDECLSHTNLITSVTWPELNRLYLQGVASGWYTGRDTLEPYCKENGIELVVEEESWESFTDKELLDRSEQLAEDSDDSDGSA